ncbi:mCG1027988, partial [Mus musculus]
CSLSRITQPVGVRVCGEKVKFLFWSLFQSLLQSNLLVPAHHTLCRVWFVCIGATSACSLPTPSKEVMFCNSLFLLSPKLRIFTIWVLVDLMVD